MVSYKLSTLKSKPTAKIGKFNLARSEDQTTMTFSLDRELAGAVRERARSLRITVSGYLRMLADQDIGGGQILIAGPRSAPAPAPKPR